MSIRLSLCLSLLWLAASGCAFDVYSLSSTPTVLSRNVTSPKSFVLASEIVIADAPCGYSRTLRAASRWEQYGVIPEGEVYRSRDQVLTVECSHVHEAHLVVSGGTLNGFYLPVEKSYVSLPTKISLPLL